MSDKRITLELVTPEKVAWSAPADFVVAGTPIDLVQLLPLSKPVVRARYEYAEASEPGLAAHVDAYLERRA